MIAPEPDNTTWTFYPGERRNTPFTSWVGDQITIRIRLKLPSGVPATPENSRFIFRITDNTLGSVLYSADWDSPEVNPVEYDIDGLIEIRIPTEISDRWREGIYAAGVMIATDELQEERTPYTFFIRLRYSPVSPHRNIPYRGPMNAPILRNIGAV